MGQPDDRTAAPGEFLGRPFPALLFFLSCLIVGVAAICAIFRMHADRELSQTGEAEWIWFSKDIRRPEWVRFYATRDFRLEEVPGSAVAKVFGDRRHVLYINGFGLGGTEQKPGDPLFLHDLTPQLRRGENRVAVVLESNTGGGGLLFALDIAGVGRNVVVSDRSWRVDFSEAAIARGGRYPAVSWGEPPMYPWRYPGLPSPAGLTGSPRASRSIAARAAAQYGLLASYPASEMTFP
ncbi:MAG: hypothetical protein H7X85_09610 [Thermoanaerobaculia bacterium]|nr:hypothetical protein [Thermoanaerobaculia bacterium]